MDFSMDTSVTVFKAERITKSRIRKGQKQYLIKWNGYSSRHNTWEPETHVLDKSLILDYQIRKEKVGKRRNAFQPLKFKKQRYNSIDENNNSCIAFVEKNQPEFKVHSSPSQETEDESLSLSPTSNTRYCEEMWSTCHEDEPLVDSDVKIPSRLIPISPDIPLWRPWQKVIVTEVTCGDQSVTIYESDGPQGFFKNT